MNSNNNIRSKGSHLSREDIEKYRSTNDEGIKHAIEKDALENDFDSDALEGWSDTRLQSVQLNRLDKRFLSSNNWVYWISGIVAVTIIVSTSLLLNDKDVEAVPLTNIVQQEITIEQTDVLTPEAIEEMEELPLKEQIAIKTIVKDFSAQQKIESNNQAEPIVIEKLPIQVIEEPKPESIITKETVFGKEIYLKDLKLLDYRAYRSRPKIVTKQMILTGTPANIGETKENEEELVWKDVDVPYIDYLERTMEIFSKGQNKKALTRFMVILETYPDDLNANFYAGLCYFNLKEYSHAIQVFEKCMQSKFTNFNEEAEWYIAKSLLADGKKSEAKELFEKIVNRKGYYAVQAKKIVSSL